MSIIKAGTYKFNYNLTEWTGNSVIRFACPFTSVYTYELTFDSADNVETYDEAVITLGEPTTLDGFYFTYGSEGDTFGYYVNAASSSGYNPVFYYYYDKSTHFGDDKAESLRVEGTPTIQTDKLRGLGQTITVTEDTEVDDAFVSWFEANTELVEEEEPEEPVEPEETEIIKAGNYRFNEALKGDTALEANIAFTAFNASEDITYYCSKLQFGAQNSKMLCYLIDYTVPEEEVLENYYLPVFTNSTGWPYIDRSLQIITVTEDTEVSKEFADWFSDNTVPHGTEIIKAGTYRFDDVLVISIGDSFNTSIPVFSCGDQSFYGITVSKDEGGCVFYYTGPSTFRYVYQSGAWHDQSHRLVTFIEDVEVPIQLATWFEDNTEPVTVEPEEPEVPEEPDTPTTYTLKGKWKFIDKPEPTHPPIYQEINFTIVDGGNAYKAIEAFSGGIGYTEAGGVSVPFMCNIIDQVYWGTSGGAQTIDFGDVEQEVSPEFYNWFMINADQVYPLNGTWMFNATVSTPTATIDQDMTFVSSFNDKHTFNSITIASASDVSSGRAGVSMFYTDNYAIGATSVNQLANYTITFLGEALVYEEFYNWLTSNAAPAIKAGTYRFNDVLTQFTDGFSAEVAFTTPNIEVNNETLTVYVDGVDECVGFYFSSNLNWVGFGYSYASGNIGAVYNYETYGEPSNKWHGVLEYETLFEQGYDVQPSSLMFDKYRVITVTESALASEEFSVWFNDNTTELKPLKGRWKLNDKPTGASPTITQEDIHFTNSSGVEYAAMQISTYSVLYLDLGNVWNNVCAINDWYWQTCPNDQTINFGETEQWVSAEFYRWLIANATDVTYALKGVWRFHETLEYDYNCQGFLVFDLIGYDTDLTSIVFDRTEDGPRVIYEKQWSDGSGLTSSTYYDSTNGWHNDKSRYILIHSETVVNEDFYKVFTANADDITDAMILVEYDGRLIAALQPGKKVRLPCAELPMATDVTITAPKA